MACRLRPLRVPSATRPGNNSHLGTARQYPSEATGLEVAELCAMGQSLRKAASPFPLSDLRPFGLCITPTTQQRIAASNHENRQAGTRKRNRAASAISRVAIGDAALIC